MIFDRLAEKTHNKCEQIWMRRPMEEFTQRYPLMVQWAGNARWHTGYEACRDKSDIFGIEYVCRGNAHLTQGDKDYCINRGEVYLLHKGTRHYYGAGPAGYLFKRYVTLDGVELENMLHYLNLWDKDVIKLKEPKKFERLLREVTDLLQESDISNIDIKLSCLAYNILLFLSQTAQQTYPPIIEKALAYMQQHLDHKLSTKTLSCQLGLSDSHFRRLFKAHVHTSPLEYFNKLKLSWANNLLKTSTLTIKEIADKTGYDDPLYFSAQFKKAYGLSPRAFRVAVRK